MQMTIYQEKEELFKTVGRQIQKRKLNMAGTPGVLFKKIEQIKGVDLLWYVVSQEVPTLGVIIERPIVFRGIFEEECGFPHTHEMVLS